MISLICGLQMCSATEDSYHSLITMIWIDSLEEGHSSWHSFQVSYQGERPTEDVPSWMNESYDVWHRDPHKVIEDLLANTEFDGSVDPIRNFQTVSAVGLTSCQETGPGNKRHVV